MINRSLSKIVLTLALGVFASVAHAAKPTVLEVTAATTAAVSKAPDQAAAIVEEKVKATPEYACPIIKAAITAGKVQKAGESALVAAALTAAPEKAPEINACLPTSAAGKGSATTTEPETETETDTWNNFPGVVGTYLAVPAGGSGTGQLTEEKIITIIRPTIKIIKQRVFVPGSGS